MHRRCFLASLASSLAVSSPAFADNNTRRYDFTSVFSGPSFYYGSYGGKRIITYRTNEPHGTIIVDTASRRLFYVLNDTKVIRYGVGVGRQGFTWSGTAHVGNKEVWPDWRPPAEMIARELKEYHRRLPDVMPGGPGNPLGARALYLFEGHHDTLYRIHGTNDPTTIGKAVSSGCIRLVNEEIIDLYNRTPVGTKVIVM